jgi:hypothetical protein
MLLGYEKESQKIYEKSKMEHLDSYEQKVHNPGENGTAPSSQKTLKYTLDELIKCKKEITELNNKLLSLCNSDTKLHWLESRGSLNFPADY